MLVAIFYPLLDGGIQQIRQVYQGLTGRASIETDGTEKGKKVDGKIIPSSPSTGSTSEAPAADTQT
jgi:hypothetical protein